MAHYSEKNDILISPADTATIPIEEYRSLVKKGALLDMIICAVEGDFDSFEVTSVAGYAKRVLDTETLQTALFEGRGEDSGTTDQEQGERADA